MLDFLISNECFFTVIMIAVKPYKSVLKKNRKATQPKEVM